MKKHDRAKFNKLYFFHVLAANSRLFSNNTSITVLCHRNQYFPSSNLQAKYTDIIGDIHLSVTDNVADIL